MKDQTRIEATRDYVAQCYDQGAEHEWGRLAADPYHELEFLVTWHFLEAYLPAGGRVLDAGGGPGRYAVELCRGGHEVMLVDLSPVCVAKAQETFAAESAEVRGRLGGCEVGDICDLSRWQDETFDAAVCLGGPLSHLPEAKDRHRAVSELARVTQAGGVVVLTGIGALAVLRTVIMICSEELVGGQMSSFFQDGNGPGPGNMLWHWFRAAELRELAENCGLETVTMAGCQGLSTGLPEATNELRKCEDRWQRWLEIVLETATEPAVVDMAEHILYVGRKR